MIAQVAVLLEWEPPPHPQVYFLSIFRSTLVGFPVLDEEMHPHIILLP